MEELLQEVDRLRQRVSNLENATKRMDELSMAIMNLSAALNQVTEKLGLPPGLPHV